MNSRFERDSFSRVFQAETSVDRWNTTHVWKINPDTRERASCSQRYRSRYTAKGIINFLTKFNRSNDRKFISLPPRYEMDSRRLVYSLWKVRSRERSHLEEGNRDDRTDTEAKRLKREEVGKENCEKPQFPGNRVCSKSFPVTTGTRFAWLSPKEEHGLP